MIASLEAARALDAADPLVRFRHRFALPPGIVYLDGNSLGALPAGTPDRLAEVIRDQWGEGLIRSWNAADWIGMPQRIGAKIARLIGARADEVLVADSTSVNLYKLLSAALAADPRRRVILTEPDNFPTDAYVAQGLAATRGTIEVRVVPRDAMAAASGPETIGLLTHVHYKTGERFDLAATTQAMRERGAIVVWDLSHSVGALELDLGAAGVELAVGCGYKYLNGGPGAPAFLFVARHLQETLQSPLTGWLGHAAPFAFDPAYTPAPGIARFLCGTPPILSMAALEAGIDLFLEADMGEIAAKSARLCDLFIACVDRLCADQGLALASPREAVRRGSHVSLSHPRGSAVMQALIARGVIGDFRAPDILRFGFAPLYVGYADVWHAAEALADVLATRAWDRPDHARQPRVT